MFNSLKSILCSLFFRKQKVTGCDVVTYFDSILISSNNIEADKTHIDASCDELGTC